MGDNYDDLITTTEIRELSNQMLSAPRTSLRTVGISADYEIQKWFKTLKTYEVTKNKKGLLIAGKLTGKTVNDLSPERFARFLHKVLLFYVDVSSSNKIKIPAGASIFFNETDAVPKTEQKAATDAVWHCVYASEVHNGVMLHTNSSPRSWTRRYATTTFKLMVMHKHESTLANKWGVTKKNLATGFDFSDAIRVSELNDEELSALNAMKASNIARATVNAAEITNASYVYHQGRVGRTTNESRLLQ